VEWSSRAACLAAEPELFFPVGATGAALDDISAAKAVCGGCCVLEECRTYALNTRQPFGVWGGLDEQERRERWTEAAPVAVG
jgi:WhiB family transcriptional regulator, redox-sensing transcriptional regulator